MMKINQPVNFDFLPHYKGDGLKPFTIQLKYKSGTTIDLTGATVVMQLRTKFVSGIVFEFNSETGGDASIVISDAVNGILQFPELKEWNINASQYDYDLQVTDASGFVRTYLRGTWAVNQDITRKEA